MESDAQYEEISVSMNEMGTAILGAAIRVHRALGPGLLESVYRRCLVHALENDGVDVQEEVWLPVEFEGRRLEKGLRIDILVGGCVVVEVKAVEDLHAVHRAQLLTYLRLSGCSLGYILNFHMPRLKDGICRLVSTPSRPLRASASSVPSAVFSAPGEETTENQK